VKHLKGGVPEGGGNGGKGRSKSQEKRAKSTSSGSGGNASTKANGTDMVSINWARKKRCGERNAPEEGGGELQPEEWKPVEKEPSKLFPQKGGKPGGKGLYVLLRGGVIPRCPKS